MIMYMRLSSLLGTLCVAVVLTVMNGLAIAETLTTQESLGEKLFFDTNLSEPNGQSCASCHTASTGFADPDRSIPVSEGVHNGVFGKRNAPSNAYTMYVPNFQFDSALDLWKGGLFVDGSARGTVLGDTLSDLALVPFLNPLEMANTSINTVVRDALHSNYQPLFKSVCGNINLDNQAQVESAFDCIATSIAEFQRTERFGEFTSKYDRYLEKCTSISGSSDLALDNCAKGVGVVASITGNSVFTSDEWAGLQLFMGENNNNDGHFIFGEGATCSTCHAAKWTKQQDYSRKVQSPSWAPSGAVPPVFTNHTYINLGTPQNPHPLVAVNGRDKGLGEFKAGVNGFFRVPSLRNVDKTRPYIHSGVAPSLEVITHFYNSRDVDPAFTPGDFPETQINGVFGNLGLSANQEAQIVAFMKTLTDGSWSGIELGAFPVGAADSISTAKNTSVIIDVLANDTGVDLTINSANAWSLKGGAVSLSNSKVRYTPKADFVGEDKIWYILEDGAGRTNSGEVTITVTGGISVSPVGVTDNVTTSTNTPIVIDALANDTGTNLTLSVTSAWSLKGGSVAVNNNKISYAPKPDFVGGDKIWYLLKDASGLTNFGEVTITVTGVASAFPVGIADNVTTSTNTSIVIDALANDIGANLTLSVTSAWSLKGGSVAVSNNKITYIPKFGFVGADNIWYLLKDSAGRTNVGQINITVSGGVAAYPVATADNVSTSANVAVVIDALANDTGSNLTLTANAWSLKGGSVAIINNKIVYTPKFGFVGEDKIWYVLKDSLGRTNSGEITIKVE